MLGAGETKMKSCPCLQEVDGLVGEADLQLKTMTSSWSLCSKGGCVRYGGRVGEIKVGFPEEAGLSWD